MSYQHVVTLIYRSVPHYRAPLYEGLRSRLADRGIDFRLIYGQPSPDEAKKRDTVDIGWGHFVPSRILKVGRRRLYWQPCHHLLKDSDLVIVEQASKLVLNYVLLAEQILGRRRLALWGHGRTAGKSASRLGEAIKRFISRRVDWWFAYNEKSAQVVRSLGFPASRITDLQNSIDTRPLIDKKLKLRNEPDELSRLKSELKLNGANVGVYAGGLYKEKRLELLIQAALEIRRRVPDFELIIIGAGPEEHQIEAALKANPWIKWVGPKFDADKVSYIMLAKVMLIPAYVGLAVIDSFALEVPLVTVDSVEHGPEIDYLRDGLNGFNLPARTGPEKYAEVVAELLLNESLQERLRGGCRAAAEKYTLEEMLERFTEGITQALMAQKK